MAKLNWKVIHECDEEDGTPTCWAAEINHQLHGNWCWITNKGSYFAVEVKNYNGKFIELVRCKSPVSAKRWVSTHLM